MSIKEIRSNLQEYAKDIKHLSDYDNAHPDQEAHRRWGNQIMEYMDKQGIQVL